MEETFVAELVVPGPSPEHERVLADRAARWYGHRRVRCLDLEVRDAPDAGRAGLFVVRGRFCAVDATPQGTLQRAAQWLGLVPGRAAGTPRAQR